MRGYDTYFRVKERRKIKCFGQIMALQVLRCFFFTLLLHLVLVVVVVHHALPVVVGPEPVDVDEHLDDRLAAPAPDEVVEGNAQGVLGLRRRGLGLTVRRAFDPIHLPSSRLVSP